MRMTDAEDKPADRGAANLDGDAPHVALDWFRNVIDDVPMPAAMQNGG